MGPNCVIFWSLKSEKKKKKRAKRRLKRRSVKFLCANRNTVKKLQDVRRSFCCLETSILIPLDFAEKQTTSEIYKKSVTVRKRLSLKTRQRQSPPLSMANAFPLMKHNKQTQANQRDFHLNVLMLELRVELHMKIPPIPLKTNSPGQTLEHHQ